MKKVSSELKVDESLFASLGGFGKSKVIVSGKRMKLRRRGCRSDSFG